LDIPTINILEEYLQNFQGALIFVSHDRYFVDKIAKKLYVFKGNGGKVLESFQPYSEYLEIEKELNDLNEYEKELSKNNQMTKANETAATSIKKQTKLSYKDQREYDALPQELETLETKIEELTLCLSNPKCYEQKGIVAVSSELEITKEVYEEKVERFLELEELIESFKQ
jgi:ATP-binding cassette subfamily F protein uup